MPLTRSALESCYLQSLAAQAGTGLTVWSDVELEHSIQQTLAAQPTTESVCIFAYGSLIWNPCFQWLESAPAKLYGWHRTFCLWAPIGRGTPENPGLVLGLERGGSCHGLMFRLASTNLIPELLLMWRREMVVGSYIPRWVKLWQGNQSCNAIAFTVNPNHSCYARSLTSDQIVHTLATASGDIGSSADYLQQTLEGLRQHDIRDPQLTALQRHVEQFQRQQAVA
jgi:glutathione-specific gamma-glutamylcyclotransferase